ncbi:RAMP superfamily CRISPR-associated protein [Salinivibrio kushneri]|uniref:RAMP superfamily CRISPR-associated protein n=1 Tax=Salinivibrio kushneri TaxID=1908198 RepID=UPI000984D726|nr:RAMP superfamily CRISPR-associated protein [Salinivibrio kushneri]OOE48911.1 hypothetical protein BZG10_10410 [Salinivibrio kushneri]OOE49322.1 hypothetical protein BZG11_12165 [Salinivibrio kushneri]OOE60686.1 hypothetical protein BZG18_10875 [Salinivibrio kushneri]
MRIYYSLTTVDPIVMSQTTATTHNHDSLDYIPGSAILGAIAAKLYPSLDEAESWNMFHTGSVKFGPCFPVADHQLALPIPASWHYKKNQTPFAKDQLNKTKIDNQASQHFQRAANTQYKQCRSGYITASGKIGEVAKGISTKTAIERKTGKAKDQTLYTYAFIEAKQTFVGWVESDNQAYLSAIREQLQTPLTLGRSRNTEFGRVEIALIDPPAQPEPTIDTQQLTVWCLSDCQCIDWRGLPTYVPALEQLAPHAKGKLNPSKSFIRAGSVTRFNQKRQGYDSEQCVINKGSVLVYDLETPLSQQDLLDLQHQGLGINQHQGLGWIMINPAWATQATLADDDLYQRFTVPTKTQQPSEAQPHSALTQWVASQIAHDERANDQKEQVSRLIKQIGQAYDKARQYHNIIPRYTAGPSSTQWRRIHEELKNNNPDWRKALFDSSTGICKADNDEFGWGITWSDGDKPITFAAWLEQVLADHDAATVLMLVSQITRYDFSRYTSLKQASQQIGFSLITHAHDSEVKQ